MYIIKTPRWVKTMMPAYTWSIPNDRKALYLTFDDGPIPIITPWVLDTLMDHQSKATFFCVGENVVRNPAIYARIISEGHSVGNHTFNHLNGWKTNPVDYINNVRKCSIHVKSKLFRPPYGKLKHAQREVLKRYFKIAMWDVLSGDFDANLSPEKCLDNVLANTKSGSIIVLHDSLKAEPRLRYVLPLILTHFREKGYHFEAMI